MMGAQGLPWPSKGEGGDPSQMVLKEDQAIVWVNFQASLLPLMFFVPIWYHLW